MTRFFLWWLAKLQGICLRVYYIYTHALCVLYLHAILKLLQKPSD